MPLLSRRSLLAATAIGALARALPAFAAPPAHSFRHGEFDLTVVSDGYLQLPVSFLAPGAPVEERAALLKAAGQAGDSYHSPTNVTVIRSGDDVILADIGSGDRFMPSAGKLWANLQAAGIERSAITKVIFTHGHPDHLWGALDEFDELALPDAAFYVAGAEWDFWHAEHAVRSLPPERAGFVTGARRRFEAIREKVKMVRPGDEIVPGLSVVATPGHTQGHVSLALAGGDGLIVGGDALTHPLISFRHPDWRPVADHVPDQAAETRRKLLDRLAAERSKLIGFHLPWPGVGIVERKDSAWRFVPVA